MRVLNIASAFDRIPDVWSPHLAGSVNGQQVRLARIDGAFDWHRHVGADEAFFVVRGAFQMHYREGGEERAALMAEGDFCVVPKGVEHRPVADDECWIMMIADPGEKNTGDIVTEKTRLDLPQL